MKRLGPRVSMMRRMRVMSTELLLLFAIFLSFASSPIPKNLHQWGSLVSKSVVGLNSN